jgi:hypothetical protein
MEPDLNGTALENWVRGIDEGPFSSLCWGERIRVRKSGQAHNFSVRWPRTTIGSARDDVAPPAGALVGRVFEPVISSGSEERP